ncbi:MAG TPA: hypothetical protein VLA15_11190 [Desulfurivibrionaceae bacterium]|nr:hypothetical protein [Desulfurivibrionaceae bacterium]
MKILSLNSEVGGSHVKSVLQKKAGEELSRALSKKLGGLDSQEQKAAGETADQLLKKFRVINQHGQQRPDQECVAVIYSQLNFSS